jgi:hypothetical protein
MRTLKHFVNLTGESKNFKNIFLSQTESTPKHFFGKKALVLNNASLVTAEFLSWVLLVSLLLKLL